MWSFGNDKQGDTFENDNAVESMTRACPACGTEGHRSHAQFCLTCGRELTDASYLPADTLRASYYLCEQRQQTDKQRNSMTSTRRSASHRIATKNNNGAAATALAFATYALVPYLGILFCPGAVLMGGIGLIRHRRLPHLGGRKASLAGMVFGVMIFSAQVFLWWILYKVPEWATGVEF